MLYMRNAGDAKSALSADEHLAFIKQCETYIGQLKSNNNLIAAQPMVRQSLIISKIENGWTETPIDPSKEVQAGYYHILATDLDEAIKIAKDNPKFAFVPSATIEARPVKTNEEQTKFIYPNSKN